MAKDSYVAVLPDGKEHFGEWEPDTRKHFSDKKKSLAEEAVREAGMTTKRKDPQTVKVTVFRMEIQKGKLVRLNAGTYEVQPPLERMTSEEYEVELAEILSPLPEEFRSFVSSKAYEVGHSAGYEEVINEARELAYNLNQAVVAFKIN
jgi:hypothetical protein